MPSRFTSALARVLRIYFILLFLAVCTVVIIAVTRGPELLKVETEKRLSSMLGVGVSFETFAVSPAGVVRMTGLNINGWPQSSTSLILGKVTAWIDWTELLKQRPTIDRVEIENWVVAIRDLDRRGTARAQPTGTFPMVELSSIELKNGKIMCGTRDALWAASDIYVEALVRFDASQSTIRVRELDSRLHDGFHCSAEATLWRLGTGLWELELVVSGEDGQVAMSAKQLDDGWQWDVWAEHVMLERWVNAALGRDVGSAGRASFTAGGVNLDGSGDVMIVNPAWQAWRADTLLVDFVLRRDALLGEHISLWNQGGRLHGTAGIVRERESLTAWSNVLMDSLGIQLPLEGIAPLTLSGEAEAVATLNNGDVHYRLSMRNGAASWNTWNLLGIDAAIAGLNEEVAIEGLSVEGGAIRGVVHGTLSPRGFAVEQELVFSLGHVVRPFADLELSGSAFCRGRMVGDRDRVQWHGRLGLLGATGFGHELGVGHFAGEMRLDRRGIWISGQTELVQLRRAEDTLLRFGMADIDVTPRQVSMGQGFFQLPNGTSVLASCALEDGTIRIEHLVGSSCLEGFSTVGEGRIGMKNGSVELSHLRVLTTEGGWCVADDLELDPFPRRGSAVVSGFDVALLSALTGTHTRCDGKIDMVMKGGRRSEGWCRIDGFRRFPAMRSYPVGLEVSAASTPGFLQVDRFALIQGDLQVGGRGFIDSTGGLAFWADCTEGSLPRIILLADELGAVGLREIFDAQKGTMTARLHAFGDIESPELEGELEIAGNAEFTVKPIRTTFVNVSGDGRLSGHKLLIDEVIGETARGTARLSGELLLPRFALEGVNLDIEGRGQEFRILRGVYGIYDADVTLKKRTLGMSLEGEIRLLGGLINLPELAVEPAPPTPASLDDRWLLTIKAARGVWARDRFLNAEVAGQIDVAKTDGVVTLQGELELLRGTYTYLGRKFRLEQGRVVFLGDPDINPELDIAATTVIRSEQPDGEDIELALMVTGRLDNPVLHISAGTEQYYTEEQIKTMLLFNLTPEELESLWGDSERFATEAAATMENLLVGELARAIRAETGLDELEVLPSLLAAEERDLYVRLGKYVTPELFVSVGKGLRSMGLDEVRVEYILEELADRLGLGRRADLKLVGERGHDEYSETTYEVLIKLKYRF
jgi:hypothetical protein